MSPYLSSSYITVSHDKTAKVYQTRTDQVYIRSHVHESEKVIKNLTPENLYFLKLYNIF